MAKSILSSEKSPSRFEAFCCDLFSEIDSIRYVPTSWNYDQGRDGRASDLQSSSHPPVLCISLRKDPKVKAEEDAEKIARKQFPPKIIRICVLQKDGKDVTEAKLDDIKTVFHDNVRNIETVLADGILQISELTVQHPACFEKYYLSELENLKRALAVNTVDSEKVEMTGLRVALTTQFSDNATELRKDILKNVVLSALSSKKLGIGLICKNVSDSLKLPKVVNQEYLSPIIRELSKLDFISEDSEVYSLTNEGQQEIKRRTDEGAENLINGQQLICDTIYELTGDEIQPQDFSKVWGIVQDEISNMFLTNGIYVIQSIESILTNESKITDHDDLHNTIEALARKISILDVWGNRGSYIYQAIKDLFNENDSNAYKWLAQLGTIYVSLCSLGLDPAAQNQIEERLRNIDLLLDTDIVLSFLSPGEFYYEAINHIVKTWQRIQGNIWVTLCVLEEVAYHSWIAQREYEELWRDLKKYDNKAALRLIKNVFVRGFRIESTDYIPKYWRYYISNFQGSRPYDYSKIENILKDLYIFKIEQDIDEDFALRIKDNLIALTGKTKQELGEEELDKYRRDGLLVSTLKKLRSKRSALIVSSSTKLCGACGNEKYKLGSIEPIASISAIAYLLTMIPGVNMNMNTLKGLLFNPTYAKKIRKIDRIAIRMVQATEEYMMPFSRRATLCRNLDDKILQTATQLGRKPDKVANDFERGTLDEESTTHIVADAIDSLVLSKSEKKILTLEQEIRKLKSQK
jgi:hypothetical protein